MSRVHGIRLTPDRDAGGFVVTFSDVSEAITQGEDVEDALHHAVGALETVLMIYISRRADLPRPSRARKKGYLVTLPALSEAKMALYQAMKAAAVGKGEPARKLRWPVAQIERLLDLNYASRLDQIELALEVLKKWKRLNKARSISRKLPARPACRRHITVVI